MLDKKNAISRSILVKLVPYLGLGRPNRAGLYELMPLCLNHDGEDDERLLAHEMQARIEREKDP
jgi:hypothetical protein